ncbi:MAG: glycosyltransferase family 2 protein [Acidobacteriota bacterium]|nr:glycosyltransferase family 2 protein [Acidobacteriota bacterium]
MSYFSVVIPTHNRARLLDACLTSVFAQRFVDYDVVVVDDGSTDDTPAVLARYGDRVRVCRQQNRGPGAARNVGIRHAQGRYVAFLDSDDVWFPWTLEVYARAIGEAHEPAFVAGKPALFRSLEELRQVAELEPAVLTFDDYYASGEEWRWWGVSSFVVRADALADAGGFTDEWINGEDADLAMRLGLASGFVQVCAPCTFGYREHAGSAIASLERTHAGARYAVTMEQAGRYPGGRARARERRRILTRHVRPVILECLRESRHRDAWRMYRATFVWHLQLRRWRFLLGFPALTLSALWRNGIAGTSVANS